MSGSYSNLAALDNGRYIFAWQSRGAVNLTPDSWMGDGFTQASPRWLNHNVAIATMDAKNKLAGSQAISTVGAASGDDQVTWITKESGTDHQNVRVASAGSGQLAVVTWEQLTNPTCEPVPLSCSGTFGGTYAQLVDATGTGSKVGDAVNLGTDVTISGDIVTIGTQVCWPFVKQTWDLSKPKSSGTAVTKMSFACLSTDGSTAKVETSSSATSVAATSAAAFTAAAEPTTTAAASTELPETASVAAEPTSTAASEPTTTEEPAPEPTSTEAPAPESTTEAPEVEPTTTEAAEPTSEAPDPTSEAPEPTSAAPEPESTSVATEAPEPTTMAPAPSASEPASTSTRRYRPTKYWGRPHHTTYASAAAQQAEPTTGCS